MSSGYGAKNAWRSVTPLLQFGTELVSSADGSICAMLGASPGASTAVAIMLDVIKRCFAAQLKDGYWNTKLVELIPSLIDNPALCQRVRAESASTLRIEEIAR